MVGRFLELQGDDLAGGLVFRRYVRLKPLSTHPESGMPLGREYRVFVLDGEALLVCPYWEHGEYEAPAPSLEPFRTVMRRIRSRFFSMDIAQSVEDEWLVMEVGDGQVSSVPRSSDLRRFYEAIADRLA